MTIVVPAVRLRVVPVARTETSVPRAATILPTLAMIVARVMTIVALLAVAVAMIGVTVVVRRRHTLDTIAGRVIRDSVPIMGRNTPTAVRTAMADMVDPDRTSAAGEDTMINGVTGGRRRSCAKGWRTDLAVNLSVPRDLPRHTVSTSPVEWDRVDSQVHSVGPPSRAVT